MACRDKDKFITSEAATKSAMRTQGAIDRFLNIINLNKFRELNFRWSDDAKRRFGITERLFFEEDTRAVPNSKAFTEIDNKKGIFYQIESKDEYIYDNVVEKLSGFQLYENRNKLCAEGICNYTAGKSTKKLEEIGLNPFPNITGSHLPVTVKSPVGDFDITHYVSAVAINGGIYIYDMPQHEFISNEFFGEIDTVDLKEKYKPRLIPLTIDEISANYNLSLEEAGRFIYSVLNTRESNMNPSFRDYINSNIENSYEYITLLESEISNSRYEKEKYETREEFFERTEKEKNEKLSKKLSKNEQDRVIRYFENKLKLKTREYLPKKTDKFRLVDLVRSIIGNRLFYGVGNSFEESLENLKRYLSSDTFIDELYNRVSSSKTLLDEVNSKINNVYRIQRMFLNFIKNMKVYGIKESLNLYSKNDQYEIRRLLPTDILDKYKSNSQAALMLGRYWSNRDNVVKRLGYGKNYEELVSERFKNHAIYNKYNTVLNYLKSVDFNSSYLYNIISNEAQRRYAYFEKIGNPQYQLEEVPVSTASTETISKVKEVMKKMGVDLQSLSDYIKGNPDVSTKGATGLADLTRGIIAIAEGKEDVALTEEMVHVATSILEQTNPSLVTEMISKIGNFKIYTQVLNAYKNNPSYQLSNGKPNIRKIKKEAIDKLIAELIIRQSEGSTEFPELMQEVNRSTIRTWWQKILDWFRGEYRKANINIFEEAAQEVMSGRTGVRYYNDNKLGVDRLFEENPELADIGTKEQYSAYLQTIFPDSKVKDIVYHGSNQKIEQFEVRKEPLIHFGTKSAALQRGNVLNQTILNIKDLQTIKDGMWFLGTDEGGLLKELLDRNILTIEEVKSINEVKNKAVQQSPYFHENYRMAIPAGEKAGNQKLQEILKNKNIGFEYVNESEDKGSVSYAVPSQEQIHILGNEQDVEGFKEWIKTAPAEFKGNGIFFQISDAQKKAQREILYTKENVRKVESKETPDPILLDSEEANNWYEYKTTTGWERIKKRVTDRVKAWYKARFPDKKFTKEEKELNEFKRTTGIKGHKFLEEIHNRYFNPDGTLREKAGDRPSLTDPVDKAMYIKLEKYYIELKEKFFKDGKTPLVFSEVIVYDPKEKEAGTIDLLIVEESGKANIIDWKFMSVSKDANDIPWYKQGAFNIQLGRYKDILLKQYGIKDIGMNRAVPILLDIKYKDYKDATSKHSLNGIAVGSVDTSKIETLLLIPVSEESESTSIVMEGEEGFEKLDKLIKKLNALYKQVGTQLWYENVANFRN